MMGLLLLGALFVGILFLTAAPAQAQSNLTPQEVVQRSAENAARETGVAGVPNTEEPQGGLLDPDLGTALFTIIVFLVLLAILSATAWKPMMRGLQHREKSIRDSIEAASRAKVEADKTAHELEEKIAEAQRRAALQLQQAKADAVKVADAIRQQAEAEAAGIKDRTLREIDGAKQQALAEINTHAAELATAMARKILQRNLTADDQQRLVNESLAAMAAKN